MRKLDLAGKKFWRLSLLEVVGVNKSKQRMWRCLCDCGKEHIAAQQHITRGTTKSCGCFHRDKQTKHGMHKSKEWFAFQHAKARCKPTYPGHADYYDRGLRVTFESFEQFYAEIGPRPSDKHSLDRIDNDKGYEPGNVRWATREVQMRNTRCDNCEALKKKISELESQLKELRGF